ncbi:uncharacterized protein LOC129750110 [Uranotaenia lowii]|uniref:uncharacterized protein LOC129750110 n=1 Tax=Uranotaenia lowii TaxID=190385 RepID=UPI002479090B|nr:uncharacterized protein LOC129750110 [Uranotaenia lowii]
MIAIVSLVLIALFGLSSAEVEVPGTLIWEKPSGLSIVGLAEVIPPTCDGVNYYSTCYDCNQILVCSGKLPSTQQNCRVNSPTKPYCSAGICSATPTCPPEPLSCTDAGKFPDPYNCTQYHYCEAAGEDSSVYACPPKYVYNADTGLCKVQVYVADCMTAKCDPTKGFGTYGTSKTFFAICTYDDKGVLSSVDMAKCPNNTLFDTVNGSGCKFTCPKDGNFANPMDPTFASYYLCYTSGVTKVASLQKCAEGKAFDVAAGLCTAAAYATTTPAPAPAA